jgi:hypothetical protein
MRSATRTPVLVAQNTTATYNFRPTLFISLPGADPSPDIDSWQTELERQIGALASSSNPRHSQYMHFAVDWDSDEVLRRQVEDLGGLVNDFLNNRAYPWDVVIVGHSRGGIFAHELTRKIVGNNNLKNLHTFLLDPTAATVWGDLYPRYKHDKSPTHHYGSLYYDTFPWLAGTLNVFTEGDQPITGYDNYGLGSDDHVFASTHEMFAYDWITDTNTGFARALDNIWSVKDIGSFDRDGNSGYEVVTIREKDVYIDGDISISGGNIAIWGNLTVGFAQASIDAIVGKDGIEVSASLLVATAQVSIREDHASVALNTGLASAAASISGDGANLHVDVLGASGSVFIGSGNLGISASVGGSNGVSASISTSGTKVSIGGHTILSF